MALKWSEAKPGEWSGTQGRRLSTQIVGSLPCRETDGREACRVGQRVCKSGGLAGAVVGVSSLGASVPRARRNGWEYGRDLRGAGLRATRPRIGPRTRTHGSGGEGPGAVDAVYRAPVWGPKGK